MEQFNLRVLGQFWAIAKSYWSSEEKWSARGLLLLVVILSLIYTGLSVLLNNKRGELISSLSALDESRFWQTILVFTLILVAYAPQFAAYVYVRDRLGLQWRRWLTDRFVDNYFSNRAYYDLNYSDADIDNPDQRIAEDVKSFTQESLTFALVILDSMLAVVAFGGVLWGISPKLVLFLVLYAVAGTLITVGVFGKALVRLNFEQLKKEADFRFSLVRIRENAEGIAFYGGEDQESSQVKQRFMAAFDNFKRLIFWELNLNILTNAYEFIPFILPALVVAPSIFSGDLEVGKVSEAQGAFIRVFFSLNLIVARFQELTTFGAGIERLYTFAAYLESEEQSKEGPKSAGSDESTHSDESTRSDESAHSDESTRSDEFSASDEKPVIQTLIHDRLALDDLTLMTPNYQRTLVENLSVTLPLGQGLLIRGPSGCGKSSLLRAIANLWESGSGKILRPQRDHMLFLPQRPYMVMGSLKDQVLYPNVQAEVEEEHLKQVLRRVNLPNLDERFEGGFEAEEDWSTVLSLGEQQRITFARLLLNKPKYVILDEATSALDLKNEADLYQQLLETGTTFLSVGHRETLTAYHQFTLDLSEQQTWHLSKTEVHNGDDAVAMVD